MDLRKSSPGVVAGGGLVVGRIVVGGTVTAVK